MTKFIIKSYILWFLFVLFTLFFVAKYFPLQSNFLGGGINNYLKNPVLWSFANFDGEHYLAIAKEGYKPLTYFFFPVYPILVRFLGGSLFASLFVSHIALILSLFGLYKLVVIDYDEKVAKLAIILMLSFPTSFYFAAAYTESLFMCLVVWSFYFFRTKKYLLSGLLGGIASGTRLVGSVLLPSFILADRKIRIRGWNFLLPSGIVIYMVYLYIKTGDFLAFFNSISIFGDQRSTKLILLPQVFYRYFIKIIPNLNYNYFPVVFTTIFEILVSLVVLFVIINSFKKIKFDYWVYMVLTYLIPTLSGSFSSLPRYVLVIFPLFIYASSIIVNKKKLKIITVVLMGSIMSVALCLFSRGYWIS